LANFPSKAYSDFLISDPSFRARFPNHTPLVHDAIKERIASVNLFFNELSEFTVTEESKFSLQNLISNIGGILGLFLGKFECF
jgi:hypothetical protein